MSATAFQRLRREKIAKMRAEAEKTEDKKLTNLTNKEIMVKLDELGIDYDKKANKATLMELLEGAE